MTEADAEGKRHKAHRKQGDRVHHGRSDEADGREDDAEHERRLVAELPNDRPDQAALDDGAQHAEGRKEISGSRRIEPEAFSGEQC